MKRPPRVVLDTNVVLSALIFGAGPTAGVRTGWQSRRFVPLASTATVRELARVLRYPKFGLSTAEQEELLADYLPWVQVVQIPEPPPRVPACRDPFDLPFLHLAVAGKAHVLVSGDRDVLTLAGASNICAIVTVHEFCRRHLEG